jgi:hypothetical protein
MIQIPTREYSVSLGQGVSDQANRWDDDDDHDVMLIPAAHEASGAEGGSKESETKISPPAFPLLLLLSISCHS